MAEIYTYAFSMQQLTTS